jgi:hypothetical protein
MQLPFWYLYVVRFILTDICYGFAGDSGSKAWQQTVVQGGNFIISALYKGNTKWVFILEEGK